MGSSTTCAAALRGLKGRRPRSRQRHPFASLHGRLGTTGVPCFALHLRLLGTSRPSAHLTAAVGAWSGSKSLLTSTF